MSLLVWSAGALIGLGVFLLLRELFPAPPALTAALQRFDPHTRPSTSSQAQAPGPGSGSGPGSGRWGAEVSVRVGQWLADRITGTPLDVRIPRTDLALLGKSVEGYLTQKLLLLTFGFAAPALVWTWLLPPVPWLLSGGFAMGYALFMFVAPDIAIRSQARQARHEFRTALVAYLDLVTMARAAGAGPAEALETPVRICHDWVFERLATALDPAARGTRNTWDELDRLAHTIGVRELAEVAAIARRAATQGTRILDSLAAKAASLREQHLAQAQAQAKSRTETMTVPVALSVIGYLILLGYPAYARITGT